MVCYHVVHTDEREAKSSVRIETARVSFRWWRVKRRGLEITHTFLNKLLRELLTFFRRQPCYSSGNVDGNQEKLITASDQSSLLWVAVGID